MYLQKVISRKNCVQDPDPDPLVRSMDPRIRIRIHPKMSWIRNTVAVAERFLEVGCSLLSSLPVLPVDVVVELLVGECARSKQAL